MIVLTKEQKDLFLDIKKEFQGVLNSRNVDLVPIEIKGNLWILPSLDDERYSELKFVLIKDGLFQKFQERNVDASEFIQYSI